MKPKPKYIRGPQLRQRWGDMRSSTFYDLLTKGLMPKPVYPFGPHTPYWDMAVIEAHERKAQEDVAA